MRSPTLLSRGTSSIRPKPSRSGSCTKGTSSRWTSSSLHSSGPNQRSSCTPSLRSSRRLACSTGRICTYCRRRNSTCSLRPKRCPTRKTTTSHRTRPRPAPPLSPTHCEGRSCPRVSKGQSIAFCRDYPARSGPTRVRHRRRPVVNRDCARRGVPRDSGTEVWLIACDVRSS